MKTLMVSLLVLAFLAAPVLATGVLAAEDSPSIPAPAEDQNSSSSSAPAGVGSSGKRCGSGHAPSV